MRACKFKSVVAALFLATITIGHRAHAYEISQVGQFTGGNPCDQPGQSSEPYCAVYEVSGLQPGDAFGITWNYVGPNDVVDVEGTITVLSIVNDTMTMNIELTNNSVADGGGPAAITAFGLTTATESLDPAATGFVAGGQGAVFDGLAVDDNKDSKLAGVVMDVCVFSVGCSGGNVNTGLSGGGNSDNFTIELVASDGLYEAGATLGTFLIKYQGANSFELPDLPLSLTSNASIPEPGTLTVLGIGLAGLGAMRRREAA